MANTNSFQVPYELFDREDISPQAKLVFVCFCRSINENGQTSLPYSSIAQYTGFSLSTVRRAVSELVDVGLVQKSERHAQNGFQASNLYTLVPYKRVPREQAGLSTKKSAVLRRGVLCHRPRA